MLDAYINKPRRKKISLTALIDVVFILLLFFMLTSSFSQSRAVNLSQPIASAATPTPSRTQLLLLYGDGHVRVHNSDFFLADYRELSGSHLTELDNTAPVVLLTESSVQITAITELLSRLNALNFEQTTLGGLLPEDRQ
ncbi:ExbD/TolR family protein [Teredinibacter turnerae]|uniref:ExbD/TolR family protein n=1 Tax=Teredinibacter turnerae TaxID=2426 RepID=UPI00036EDAFC|nr:biopolymer transporter ExbD [Teredinibacter turnerae]